MANRPNKQSERRVSFNKVVLVWQHDIILGDNPACSLGPPVTLDWRRSNINGNGNDKPYLWNLNDQERVQEARYAAVMVKRRRLRQKHEYAPQGPPVTKLNYHARVAILQAAGYNDQQLRAAERIVQGVRRCRSWTLQQTLPSRYAHQVQHAWRKHVQGQGSQRHKRALVKGWYTEYHPASIVGMHKQVETTGQ